MTILRSGASKQYADNWDKAFGSEKTTGTKKVAKKKAKTAKVVKKKAEKK